MTTGYRRLYRSRDDRMIAGVCGGIAEYFGLDPTLVRIGYVLLSAFSVAFPGILAYIVMAIIVPERPRGS
ncbi:MAG: PspC domain-containing protein [Actinomycetes bacterium]|jgi:phage shock protein C|nr:MAG: PspC domain-containing protein [Actinomycetota bacterium]